MISGRHRITGEDDANSTPRRTLVIFPGALGDLVCLGPALAAIRRRCPDAPIDLMARAELVRLAIGRFGVDGGESIDRGEVSLLFSAGGRPHPETVTFFARWSRIYSFFASADAGFRQRLMVAAGKALVTFHRFRPAAPGQVAFGYLKAIGETGESSASWQIRLRPEDLSDARRRLDALGLHAGNFAAFFPGSGSPAKNWPAARFVELAVALKPHLPVLFIAGPAEAQMLAPLAASGLPVLSELELPAVAALAASARFFVGNDSGVSHLAAAAGATGVVLFGPTEPQRWRPLGEVAIIRSQPIGAIEPSAVIEVLKSMVAWREVPGPVE